MNFGAPGAIRTPDPLVRSQVLYPLSYGHFAFNRLGIVQHLGQDLKHFYIEPPCRAYELSAYVINR